MDISITSDSSSWLKGRHCGWRAREEVLPFPRALFFLFAFLVGKFNNGEVDSIHYRMGVIKTLVTRLVVNYLCQIYDVDLDYSLFSIVKVLPAKVNTLHLLKERG